MRHAVLTEKAAADYAPGIKEKGRLGDLAGLEGLTGRITPYTARPHLARRAGRHVDLRLLGPEGLLSWALPKGMPAPGEKRLGVRTELHEPEYREFVGEIPEGYGAGTVEPGEAGNVMVTRVKKDDNDNVTQINFSTVGGQIPERFVLKKMPRTRQWLVMNVTPTKAPKLDKTHYKVVEDPRELDALLDKTGPDQPASVKIDGALGLLEFMKDRAEILSYRTSRRTGGPIVHTERLLPELLAGIKVPEDLRGKTLLGEIFATRKGRAVPSQELSGLLNMAVGKAVEKKKGLDGGFRMALFDVLPAGLPADEKERLIDLVISRYPQFFMRPPEAKTPGKARRLLEQVVTGKHPLSEEGLVFGTPGKPTKYKKTLESDVIIHSLLPGKGKHEGTGVGSIMYKLRPEQTEPVGRVGTGLSDELRREMREHPEQFIGRVAKIRAQGQFPSGAFRAPRLLSIHEDYPHQLPSGETQWGSAIEERRKAASHCFRGAETVRMRTETARGRLDMDERLVKRAMLTAVPKPLGEFMWHARPEMLGGQGGKKQRVPGMGPFSSGQFDWSRMLPGLRKLLGLRPASGVMWKGGSVRPDDLRLRAARTMLRLIKSGVLGYTAPTMQTQFAEWRRQLEEAQQRLRATPGAASSPASQPEPGPGAQMPGEGPLEAQMRQMREAASGINMPEGSEGPVGRMAGGMVGGPQRMAMAAGGQYVSSPLSTDTSRLAAQLQQKLTPTTAQPGTQGATTRPNLQAAIAPLQQGLGALGRTIGGAVQRVGATMTPPATQVTTSGGRTATVKPRPPGQQPSASTAAAPAQRKAKTLAGRAAGRVATPLRKGLGRLVRNII